MSPAVLVGLGDLRTEERFDQDSFARFNQLRLAQNPGFPEKSFRIFCAHCDVAWQNGILTQIRCASVPSATVHEQVGISDDGTKLARSSRKGHHMRWNR